MWDFRPRDYAAEGADKIVSSVFEWEDRYVDSLKRVIVLADIPYIKSSMIGDCRNLETIYLPRSVTGIDNYAFRLCYNLRSVYFAGDAPYLPQEALPDYGTIRIIHKPGAERFDRAPWDSYTVTDEGFGFAWLSILLAIF